MGSRYLTDLADVVRGAGLTVQEEPGWQTRSRSSGGYDSGRPDHVMVHHTASNPGSDGQPDVDYMCYSSENRPVANLYLSRSGKVWVMAAGATNTNGQGADPCHVVPDDSMNTHAVAVEAANNGTGEPWPAVQQDAYVALVNALCARYGIANGRIHAHFEWAPDRKIDPAGQSRYASGSAMWNMTAFRSDVAAGGGPPPLEDSDMLVKFVVTDGKTPAAQYVSNGIWYRHLDNQTAVDCLSLFMGVNGHDTKLNQISKAQVDGMGAYIADNGTIGAANPYL